MLASVNGPAQAAGLAPGQPLADARAICPGLVTVPADAAGIARTLTALADWCSRYTPWTAPDCLTAAPGAGDPGLWLDVTGCAHLSGGEAALLDDLLRRLAGAGYRARAAVAGTPGTAWAMARFGPAIAVVVPVGEETATLADLPVAALRLPPGTVEMLNRLGLRHIGDLTGLPRATLEARFGSTRGGSPLLHRLDQALGRAAEPISAFNNCLGRPLPPWRVRLALPEPVDRRESVDAGLGRLLAALCERLKCHGLGARRLVLRLFHSDATVRRAETGTSQPSREPGHLARLLGESLDRIGLFDGSESAGIDLMILEAPVVEPRAAKQLAFAVGRYGKDAGDDALGSLVDRLTGRLGRNAVIRIDPHESHMPERTGMVARPFDAATRRHWPRDRVRPIHLLPRPEAVEVTTAPDGRPERLRWRRVTRSLACATGPERIAPEWWCTDSRDEQVAIARDGNRDYYRVEDERGGRFWLFQAEGGWFLHGIFA